MKKILSFLVCFALLAVLCPVFFTEDAQACGDCMAELREQGYEYLEIGKYELAVKGDEAILIHYYGGSRDSDVLTFEHEVEGYRIVKVWDNAFETAHERKIIIPDGVIELGDAVFEQCPILEEVVLPSTLRVLGKAFTNCPSLKRIVIPEGMETISGTIAYYCETLEEVALPSTLRRIDGLLEGCPMVESVVLPEGLESIGGVLFFNCESVKSLEIPASVTYMAGKPFHGKNSFESMTVAPSSTYLRMENGCLYTTDGVLLYGMDGCSLPEYSITAIADYAFAERTNLQSVKIPHGLTSIGEGAFQCTDLVSAILPDTVTEIGEYAFDGCNALEEFRFPKGVTSVPRGLLNGCSSLKELEVPEGVTNIAPFALTSLKSLEKLTLPSTLRTLCENAISYMPNLKELVFQWGRTPFTVESGCITNENGTLLTILTGHELPQGITTVGNYAFYQYEDDQPLFLPEGITSLGEYAFAYAELPEVVLPASLTAIFENAFYGSSIETIFLPETLEYLDYGCFEQCFFCGILIFKGRRKPLRVNLRTILTAG